MVKKLRDAPFWSLTALRAVIMVLLFLFKGTYIFCAEKIYRHSGRLMQGEYTVDDFTQNSIVDRDGKKVSTDNDPQLIMEYGGRISHIDFQMERDIYPGEMVVYYTEKAGEPFSENKRVWIKPSKDWDNTYTVDLEMKNVKMLRIDPTMYAGNRMTFGTFSFNRENSALSYFTPSYGDIFNLILYSGLAAALAKVCAEGLVLLGERRRKSRPGDRDK